MKKAFFLDRDGVIIEDANYLSSPEQVVLCPGTPEAFRKIKNAGYEIVVVSNQSGIARGYFTCDDLAKVEKHMQEHRCLRDGIIVRIIKKVLFRNMRSIAIAGNRNRGFCLPQKKNLILIVKNLLSSEIKFPIWNQVFQPDAKREFLF